MRRGCATASRASSTTMMTTPDALPLQPATGAAPERRLHPWSWLFVLLQQLRQFVIPLIAAFFFGGNRNELWPLIGVGVLALVSLLQYLTYRYRVGSDALSIRSGWLHRSRREIPFVRIHNVAVQQTLLHRMFGVAELRLESAGGHKPEAQMRVLRLEDALALERLIRHRRPHPATAADDAAPADTVLLALPTSEVLRHGLSSNRGLLLLGGAAAAVSQASPRLLPNLMESWGKALFGWAGAHHFGGMQLALGALSLALAFVVVMRLLSIASALLQYHGFRLTEHGRRLTVERGLLARLRTSVSRRRLQAWTLQEGVLHRMFRRRSLLVDTAAGASGEQGQRTLRELAPIATPAACDALIAHLLPSDAGWPALSWQSLDTRAWWRVFLPGAGLALAVCAALTWRFGTWGLLALAWLPWSAFVARRHMQQAGYAVNARLVAVREGWWSRYWRFAEIDRLQALQLSRSPLDRRFGTATLWLDTAGAAPLAPPLRIRFMPEAAATALHAQLASTLARRAQHW